MRHRRVSHFIGCADDSCSASFELTIHGEHDLRSVTQAMSDLMEMAGWSYIRSDGESGTEIRCPVHRHGSARRLKVIEDNRP